MPEGLIVALALRELDYSISHALGLSLLTGLVEPIAGVLSASIVNLGRTFLPWVLGRSLCLGALSQGGLAGAMLFVIVDQIIPEIDRANVV